MEPYGVGMDGNNALVWTGCENLCPSQVLTMITTTYTPEKSKTFNSLK